ncbi:Oidioi.mRNA.OKI2018_I69.chr2.g8410.t1.cds [Oikopleura dioica]|uniref:Oidioi.mRNA.OKI2018_I69.chr2.g8410.t1.cds n=1 Tax=Oikopleura dioica TaxID=34765 RepID=A0ABN7T955_OIKDI|nr:Oidioi.mRNA.OKI2018_I69.chr2.g8410.t1.cds [Oikopleura dioica]
MPVNFKIDDYAGLLAALEKLNSSEEFKDLEKTKDGREIKKKALNWQRAIERKKRKIDAENKENQPIQNTKSGLAPSKELAIPPVAPLSSDSEEDGKAPFEKEAKDETVVNLSSDSSTPSPPKNEQKSAKKTDRKRKLIEDSDITLKRKERERSPTKSPAYFNKPVKLTKFGENELQLACKKGSLSEVMKFVNEDQDVNHKDYSNLTPLHDAVNCGDIEIIEFLIKENANLNVAGGPERSTPLILAVSEDRFDVAKLLLEYNADPHRCDKNGKTASDLTKNPKILKLLNKAKEKFEADETSFELTLSSNPKVFIHKSGWKKKTKMTAKEIRELRKSTSMNIVNSAKGIDILVARKEILEEEDSIFVFLKALYNNVWIVSPDYLENKEAKDCFLDVCGGSPKKAIEDEARGENQKLLEGLKVFIGRDLSTAVGKNLMEIFVDAGAETLRREPKFDSDAVQADQSIIGMDPYFQYTHWIVTNKKTDKKGKVACVPVKWVLECLKLRKIVDF